MTSIISTETLTRREPTSPKTAKSEAPDGAKGFDAAMDHAQDTKNKAHKDTEAASTEQGKTGEAATKPTEQKTPDTEKRLRSLMALRDATPDIQPDAPDAANPDDAQDVAVDAVLLTVLEPTADAPVPLAAPIPAVAAHSEPQDTLPLATAAATMLDTDTLPTPEATPSAPAPLATSGTEPETSVAMTDTTFTTPAVAPDAGVNTPEASPVPALAHPLPKADTAIDLGLIPAAETSALGIGSAPALTPLQFAQVQGTTAPTLNTTMPTWQTGMVEHITQRVKDGVQEFEINLAPEKLGHVSIKIDLRGDAANITIVTQTADAQKLFNDNQDRLSAMFAQAGLELGQHNTQSQGQNGAGAERGTGGQSQASDTERAPDPTTAPRRSAGSATLVDLVA